MQYLFILVLAFVTINTVNAQTLEQNIKTGEANKIKALIGINGGQLRIKEGSSDLANVKFNYDKNDWNPSVSYTEDDSFGKLIVKASTEGDENNIDDDNKCLILLNKGLTYSLGISLGAGVADLNFEGFNIEKALIKLGVGSFDINLANTSLPFLKVEAGIGEATIDLSGHYKNDLRAQVKAGIGELEVIVPENMGVKFEINGFLGDVDAKGFKKDGNNYINKQFGESKHSIYMKINGAIGSINIISK